MRAFQATRLVTGLLLGTGFDEVRDDKLHPCGVLPLYGHVLDEARGHGAGGQVAGMIRFGSASPVQTGWARSADQALPALLRYDDVAFVHLAIEAFMIR